MLHSYDEYYLPIEQSKLASMVEIAVYHENIAIDDFFEKFISSPICRAFEEGNPIYILGKSANELLALMLNKIPQETEQNMLASPEYWVGWVLAYSQWYLNKPFADIIKAYPCSKLLLNYFPYHEMDETATVELIQKNLPQDCPLKTWRKKRQLSQAELAEISGVPARTIKAYEQGKLDISKAQADTLYKLARTLDCKIEDLIK